MSLISNETTQNNNSQLNDIWLNTNELNEKLKVFASEDEIILSQNVSLGLKGHLNRNTLVFNNNRREFVKSFVLPNLLSDSNHISRIVTDLNGEIYDQVKENLKTQGYDIKVLNLLDMSQSNKYNPMEYIKNENDATNLANIILYNSWEQEPNEIFKTPTEALLTSLIFLVGVHGDELHIEKTLLTVLNLLKEIITDLQNNTNKASAVKYFEAMNDIGWYFDNNGTFVTGKPLAESCYEYHSPKGIADYGVKKWNLFTVATSGKTRLNICLSLAVCLSVLNVSAVTNLVSDDEFCLDMLRDKKTVLFVIVPATNNTYNFLAATLYAQVMNFTQFIYKNELNTEGNHIQCIMSDASIIRYIPNMDMALACAENASYVIHAKNIAELKQCKRNPYEAAELYGINIFQGTIDSDTSEYLYNRLGGRPLNNHLTQRFFIPKNKCAILIHEDGLRTIDDCI